MDGFYTTDEVAKILKIKVRTVREWIRNGKLKAKRYDKVGKYFVTLEEIQRKQQEME